MLCTHALTELRFCKNFHASLREKLLQSWKPACVLGCVCGRVLSGVEGSCLFEGRSKAGTQLSQSFPTVVEVGGIHKCMIYIKCPVITMLNIMTLSSWWGKLLPPWGSKKEASNSPGWPEYLMSLPIPQTEVLALRPDFSSAASPWDARGSRAARELLRLLWMLF